MAFGQNRPGQQVSIQRQLRAVEHQIISLEKSRRRRSQWPTHSQQKDVSVKQTQARRRQQNQQYITQQQASSPTTNFKETIYSTNDQKKGQSKEISSSNLREPIAGPSGTASNPANLEPGPSLAVCSSTIRGPIKIELCSSSSEEEPEQMTGLLYQRQPNPVDIQQTNDSHDSDASYWSRETVYYHDVTVRGWALRPDIPEKAEAWDPEDEIPLNIIQKRQRQPQQRIKVKECSVVLERIDE